MDRPRTSRSDTDTQASGVLGETRRHECGRFLVAYANVLDAVLALTQGFDDRIYTVTDDTKDMCCTPIDQSFDQNVGCVQLIARGRRWLRCDRFVCFRGCGREGLADVSAARPVIAVPCRKSRRKNPVLWMSRMSIPSLGDLTPVI